MEEEKLDTFFKNKEFKAINVTIPYKEKVIKYLDFIDEKAKLIGAINTIVNKNGKLYGYNTDYLGLLALIRKNDIEVDNKKVLILGTGGTSKTAYQIVKDLNASIIKKASRKKGENTLTYDEIYQKFQDVEVIINTTPVGMYPNNEETLIDFNRLKKIEAYIDVIYNPIKTRMALNGEKVHIKTVNGLYMLVSQAIYAYLYFNDLKLNDKEISKLCDDIYSDVLKSKLNIALIGMPTCGKTTIGKMVALELSKEFVDTDDVIKERINMEIKDYIKAYGEAKFREIEEDVIKEVSKVQNQVIATGGGCILREENIISLKQNSIIYFINRSPDLLICASDRPLSSSKDQAAQAEHQHRDVFLRPEIIEKRPVQLVFQPALPGAPEVQRQCGSKQDAAENGCRRTHLPLTSDRFPL